MNQAEVQALNFVARRTLRTLKELQSMALPTALRPIKEKSAELSDTTEVNNDMKFVKN